MRIEEEYRKVGYFWLPENPDKKIPGTLTIFNGGKIELEIVDLFDDIIKSLNGEDDLSRIIGHVEKDELVTLDDCFYTNKSISFGGISKSLIHVNLVLSGVAYDKEEEITFNTLSFSVDCMDEWVGISGIKVLTDYENMTTTINYEPQGSFSYSLANGMRLEVCFAYTLPGFPNITEAKITQRAYFKLSSEEPRPLNDFTTTAYKITNLLCFAIDTTVSLKTLAATSNEIQQCFVNGNSYPVPIYVYYKSIPFSEKVSKVNWHQMIFTFGVIKENAEDVFNKWISAYDTLAPALGLYFSTKIKAQKYLEGKFLALAQGLETYHRRTSNEKLMDDSEFEELVKSIMKHCPEGKAEWLQGRLKHGNEINFGKRIKKIIEPFKEHIGSSRARSKIIQKIVDTRNYLTHYDEDIEPEAAKGRDLWVLCLKMEAIFQLHFLKVIGFTEEEVSNVVQNGRPLRRKLDEI